MKVLLTIFLRAYLLAAVLAGCPAFAQKMKPTSAKIPPPPIARAITLDRGQQVTVPLAVHGTGVENMEFIIRTAPKVGRLSGLQITGNSTAAVIYTAPEETDAAEDRFTYAVRTADGVSAPAFVTITIAEAVGIPPRLVAPAALEMEAIRPGESTTVTIAIKNAGGGFAQGELRVPAPWKLEGPAKFRLSGGDKMDFKVSFSSTQPGTQKADVSYGPGQRVSTTLTANVLPPFTLAPALLELKSKPGAATRSGQVRITNEGTEPQMISIKHGGKLLTETSITVPGRQTHNLAVFAEPGEVGSLEDHLKFKSGDWSGEITVIARPLAAIVSCKEKSVQFGSVTTDRTALSEVNLENTGGSAIALTFTASGPFRTDPTSIALKPKNTAKIAILFKAESPGAASGMLSISGNSTHLEIPLFADAKAPTPTPRPVLQPTSIQREELTPPVNASPVPFTLSQPATAAEIPNLTGKPRDVKPTSATLEWTSTPKPNLRAQQRMLSAGAGGVITNWRDLEAKFTQEGAVMHCHLKSLKPQTLYTIRIVADSTTECTVNLITSAKPPFPISLRSVLITLMIGTAGWLLYKRWKATAQSGW